MKKSKVESNYIAALFRILKTQDPQTAPEYFNADSIQPVLDVGFGGWNQADTSIVRRDTVAINGITTPRCNLIAPLGLKCVYAAGVTTTDPLISIDGNAARCFSLFGKITFDAAGLAAWAGKTLQAELRYYNIAGTYVEIGRFSQALGASLNYFCFYRDLFSGFFPVPALSGLALSLAWRDETAGAAFPANTTMSNSVSAVVVAKNGELPI